VNLAGWAEWFMQQLASSDVRTQVEICLHRFTKRNQRRWSYFFGQCSRIAFQVAAPRLSGDFFGTLSDQ